MIKIKIFGTVFVSIFVLIVVFQNSEKAEAQKVFSTKDKAGIEYYLETDSIEMFGPAVNVEVATSEGKTILYQFFNYAGMWEFSKILEDGKHLSEEDCKRIQIRKLENDILYTLLSSVDPQMRKMLLIK